MVFSTELAPLVRKSQIGATFSCQNEDEEEDPADLDSLRHEDLGNSSNFDDNRFKMSKSNESH